MIKLHAQILAGTALGLVLTTLTPVNPAIATPLATALEAPANGGAMAAPGRGGAPILLAQAQPTEEERIEEAPPASETPETPPQPEARPEAAPRMEEAPGPAETGMEAAPPEQAPEPEPRPEHRAAESEAEAEDSSPAQQAPSTDAPEAPAPNDITEPLVVPDAEEAISEPPFVPDEEPVPGDDEVSEPPVVPDEDGEGISDAPVVPDEQPADEAAPGDAEISEPPVVPDTDDDAEASEPPVTPDRDPAIGDDVITAPPEVPDDEEAGLPENAAPVLDSAKEEEIEGAPAEDQPERRAEPAEEAAPPPEDDASALVEEARPLEIESAVAEEGQRVERREDRGDRRERPDGAEILRQIGDRIVIQFNNQTIVESSDRPRLTRDAREVFYEELPRGREREIIVRGDGSQIVTIRNRYGDVVRRSRIMPDGREIVLSYVDERNYDRVRDWRDPGADLPPLRLAIPAREYILDARRARSADDYYEFLYQPPVERVQRLYSVDEVRRSARIRDSVRRVDLDTITFDFGSASIGESEIPRLEDVAVAMERLLERNPAETFLIEGHTDAVGSDLANLALSDRRAESVAEALTNVFGIPPENLVTQGYGERYLKVNTQEPERLNRRVAIRRITPLVAPVARAN